MEKKRLIALSVLAGIMALVLAGCFVEFEPLWDLHDPYGSFDGTETADAKGYKMLTVSATFKSGKITAVKVTHKETRGYGKELIENAIPLIIEYNSFEPVASLSGATLTRVALKKAGDAIIEKVTPPDN